MDFLPCSCDQQASVKIKLKILTIKDAAALWQQGCCFFLLGCNKDNGEDG